MSPCTLESLHFESLHCKDFTSVVESLHCKDFTEAKRSPERHDASFSEGDAPTKNKIKEYA